MQVPAGLGTVILCGPLLGICFFKPKLLLQVLCSFTWRRSRAVPYVAASATGVVNFLVHPASQALYPVSIWFPRWNVLCSGLFSGYENKCSWASEMPSGKFWFYLFSGFFFSQFRYAGSFNLSYDKCIFWLTIFWGLMYALGSDLCE